MDELQVPDSVQDFISDLGNTLVAVYMGADASSALGSSRFVTVFSSQSEQAQADLSKTQRLLHAQEIKLSYELHQSKHQCMKVMVF